MTTNREKLKIESLSSFYFRLIGWCLLPLGLLLAVLAIQYLYALKTMNDQGAAERARSIATVIDQHIESQIAALQVLAASPLADEPSRWNEFYRESLAFFDSFDSHVILADAAMQMQFNTRVPFGTPLPKLPQPMGHAAAPIVVATGKPAVGDVFWGPIADKKMVAMVVPVIRAAQTRFLLLSTMETTHLQHHLAETALPPGWFLTLVDSTGEVIAQNPQTGDEQRPTAEQRPGRWIVKSSLTPWSILLDVSPETYRRPVIAAAITLTLAIMAAIIISIVTARFAGNRLTLALSRLVKPAESTALLPRIEEVETIHRVLADAAAVRASMESSLRESERRFRELFELASVPLCFVDEEGALVDFNRNFVKTFGYLHEDIPTLAEWRQLAYPDPVYRKSVNETWESAVEHAREHGTEIKPIEYRVTCKNGSQRTVIISGTIFDNCFLASFFDITERKKAETALLESERILRESQEIARLGSWAYDHTGRLTWTGEMFRIFAVSPETFIPDVEKFMQLIHPQDRPDMSAWISACQAGENPGELEFRTLLADGSMRYISGRGKLVAGTNEKHFLMSGTAQDITDRKRGEIALRESEELFRSLFQYHAAIKLIIDPETGSIVDANEAAVRFYGWPLAQLKQMRIGEINTLSQAELREKIEEVNKRQSGYFEFRHLLADGSIRDVEVYSSSIRFKGKELLHSIIHDITERKRVAAERERLQVAIEQAGESIVVTDERGIVQYVNPAFEKITGYSPEEMIGQDVGILKSGEQDPAFYRDLWETLTAGRTWKGRMVNRRKDGTFYTDSTTISPVFDQSGMIVNYVSVQRDISENLKLAAQFQQAQKMESVGRLAGGVAHDFNNMLSVVLGHAELALEKTDPADPLRSDLEQIIEAGIRSAQIVRQLLAFARKQEVAPRVIDLNEAVQGMTKMLRRLIGEDIDLVWSPALDLCPVKIDPSQLDQILANLCVNARDAIAGVGRVIIETNNTIVDEAYCQEHDGFVPGQYVRLTVSDSGSGMDKELQSHIFEPFFTSKGPGRGTGLGLATVYGIIKQNNGLIDVESEPGRGTTFRLYFIRHKEQTIKPAKEEAVKPQAGSGEVILVVEDEVSILRLLKMMLAKLGYAVLFASSPEEALLIAEKRTGPIDLLITDVIMPGMNGRELAERLRSLYPELKCLFMSGYTSDGIARSGVLEDGLPFLQKPFSKVSLAVKVSEVLKS